MSTVVDVRGEHGLSGEQLGTAKVCANRAYAAGPCGVRLGGAETVTGAGG